MKRIGGIAVVAAALLVAVPGASANTYVPNKLGDHVPGKCNRRDCTLREAVDKANGHAGLDTIRLHGGTTYDLSRPNATGNEDLNASGDLDISGSLVIKSSNRKLATVHGKGLDRVFDLGPTSAVDVSLKRLRVRGGHPDNAGGGIHLLNNSSLVLIRSVVSGNVTDGYPGGGIYAEDGTRLKVVRSTVSRNDTHGDSGGGLEARGRVTISRSSITGNHGDGAISAYQTEAFKVTTSTIARNRAAVGGGVRFIGVSGSVGTLVNDTIANNHATNTGGGIFAGGSGGETSLNAVTVARNSAATDGGGILADDAVTMNVDNSLIGLNTASGFGPDCFADGSVVSGGHNLVPDPGGVVCPLSFMGPGDITGVNPRIAQLADNGGPTKTVAPRRRSKAINHAGNDAPARDQRGVKRHDPDIGAFERR